MPPKCKFTKQEIIQAALDMARESGMEAVTARALGERLGSSSRPIFSLFQGMPEVQQEVIRAAEKRYQAYLKADMESGTYPVYKASGIAYIRFAEEERELFKLLFMRNRSQEHITEDPDSVKPFLEILQNNLGLSEREAYLFHLEMWVFVHGIATMIATSYLKWDRDTISQMLTDSYMGLKLRYSKKENP